MTSHKRVWASSLLIAKVDQDQRIVEGFASSERLDSQGDIVDAAAIKAALPEYMKWANLRAMHQDEDGNEVADAVGTVIKAEVIDGDVEVDGETLHNPLHIVAKVVDDDAWNKVKEGVYKGFSIGGKIVKYIREKLNGASIRRITKLLLYEISLVDRPANQDAKILMWKGFNMANLAKAAGDSDLTKPIAAIQAARNAAEVDGDLDSAQLLTQAIALLLQASGDADEDAADGGADEATEGNPSADAGAADAGAGQAGTGADAQMMQAGASAADLKKAGRALNSANMNAVVNTVKSLLNMLASAGDATAAKALALYTPPPQPGAVEAGAKSASADDLSKALEPITKALEPIGKLAEQVDALAKQVEAISKQPAPGGPVLRAVDKTINGQRPPAEPIAKSAGPDLIELRRLANTEPDAKRRASYVQQLQKAEAANVRK